MSKNRPLSEVQILNGTHPIATKTGGNGFGAGSIVGVNSTAETITISNVAAPAVEEAQPEAAPALTEAKVQEMVTSMLTVAQNQFDEKLDQTKAEAAEIVEQSQQAAEAALAQVQADHAAEIERLNNELAEARKGADALAELGKLTGTNQMAQPQHLEVLGTGSQELRNYRRMLDEAPVSRVGHNRKQFDQRDTRSADMYLDRNRTAIREGIEAELREAGCLQGSNRVTNAPTVMADIPSTAFDYLANEIRRVSDSDLIYAQFARTHSVPGTAPRFQGQVPRYPFNPGPATLADRTLTPGTDINATSQQVNEDLAPVTILELGLGKDAINCAIGVSTFVSAFSMTDLSQIVARNLGRDYAQTKDLAIRSILAGATTTLYNDNGRVTATPADVGVADDGMLTRGFLRSLWTFFKTRRVPTYSGNLYAITVTPLQLQNLMTELVDVQRFVEPTSQQMEMVSKIFSNGTDYGGEVNGFRMILDGFMIFMQNTHSIGAVGTEGVQTQTLGAGAVTTETCYAMGADSMCWATALPVEIREDDYTDFGRRDRWIWYSHENAAALDVNEVLAGGRIVQERRVVKINFTRTPV